MVFLRYFLILVSLGGLGGCAGADMPGHWQLTAPRDAGGRACAAQCRQMQDHCTDGCRDVGRDCQAAVDRAMISGYEAYVQQQRRARQPLVKKPQDFAPAETCSAHAICVNACDAMYRDCYTACGGTAVFMKEDPR